MEGPPTISWLLRTQERVFKVLSSETKSDLCAEETSERNLKSTAQVINRNDKRS